MSRPSGCFFLVLIPWTSVFGVFVRIDVVCLLISPREDFSISVRDLLAELSRVAGKTVEPLYAAPRKGDVQHSLADVGRAKSVIGFCPTVGFAEGIHRTYDWYRSQYS